MCRRSESARLDAVERSAATHASALEALRRTDRRLDEALASVSAEQAESGQADESEAVRQEWLAWRDAQASEKQAQRREWARSADAQRQAAIAAAEATAEAALAKLASDVREAFASRASLEALEQRVAAARATSELALDAAQSALDVAHDAEAAASSGRPTTHSDDREHASAANSDDPAALAREAERLGLADEHGEQRAALDDDFAAVERSARHGASEREQVTALRSNDAARADDDDGWEALPPGAHLLELDDAEQADGGEQADDDSYDDNYDDHYDVDNNDGDNEDGDNEDERTDSAVADEAMAALRADPSALAREVLDQLETETDEPPGDPDTWVKHYQRDAPRSSRADTLLDEHAAYALHGDVSVASDAELAGVGADEPLFSFVVPLSDADDEAVLEEVHATLEVIEELLEGAAELFSSDAGDAKPVIEALFVRRAPHGRDTADADAQLLTTEFFRLLVRATHWDAADGSDALSIEAALNKGAQQAHGQVLVLWHVDVEVRGALSAAFLLQAAELLLVPDEQVAATGVVGAVQIASLDDVVDDEAFSGSTSSLVECAGIDFAVRRDPLQADTHNTAVLPFCARVNLTFPFNEHSPLQSHALETLAVPLTPLAVRRDVMAQVNGLTEGASLFLIAVDFSMKVLTRNDKVC